MKKYIQPALLFLAILVGHTTARATDLVVAANGAGGAYSSINAALTAATSGDRIIVYPQPGGASYAEPALVINKSIQILSANEGAYYAVDVPSISISPATPGISVTIIGMKLFSGSINTAGNSPVGNRSSINLLNDSLAQGAINLNHDNYNVTIGACHVEAGVTLKYGRLIGSIVRNNVIVNNDPTNSNLSDTTFIIGNKIYTSVSTNTAGITMNTSSQFFSIQNNLVYLNYGQSILHYGILVSTSKNVATGTNVINNNTIFKVAGTSMQYGMLITTAAGSFTEINNNFIPGALYYGGIYCSGGNFSCHYNILSALYLSGITNDGTNILMSAGSTIDINGVISPANSNAINGGSPDSAFADIDLSRNDAGCYGGSFTLNNFFPITGNDWARVLLVLAPRRVLVNGTITVRAFGFDK